MGRADRGPFRLLALAGLAGAAMALTATAAQAQELTIGLGETGVTERALQIIALITVLSLAPSILIMVTSFTRIVVVLSLLRTAIGAQQSPPNAVVMSLALFLTAFIMAPVFQAAYTAGIQPLMQNEVELPQAFEQASRPSRISCCRMCASRICSCSSTCRARRNRRRRRM